MGKVSILSYNNKLQTDLINPFVPLPPPPHLGDTHGHTLREVPLYVLQEDVGCGARDLFHLHESHVCPDLILDAVLLVDVDGLQHCELLYPSGQG